MHKAAAIAAAGVAVYAAAGLVGAVAGFVLWSAYGAGLYLYATKR